MCHRYLLNIFWMKFDLSQDVAMKEPKKASLILFYEAIALDLQNNHKLVAVLFRITELGGLV